MKNALNGSLYQDDHFEVTEFNGLKIEKLIAVIDPETKNICLVYIKFKNHYWYRFFLDLGFAVLDTNQEETIDEDDSYVYIDKTIEFKLSEKEISKIWCELIENHCQITIEFTDYEKMILRPLNPQDFESDSELIMIGNETNKNTKHR